jgi:outer membrane immunogenic protein
MKMVTKYAGLKVHLLATACVFAFAGAASAADMQLKAAPMAAMPVSSFAGWSITGLVGVGTSNSVCNIDYGSTYGCAQYGTYYGSSTVVAKNTNAIAGAEVAMDWQNRYFVYGMAADWTWTNFKRNVVSGKVDWLASFRGRMGIAIDDTMLYVTAGLALGGVKDSTLQGTVDSSFTHSDTRVGWVAGVGVEHKFTRNWSLKAEYLHYDLGTSSVNYVDRATTPASLAYKFDHAVDVARIGLTFRP